MKLSAVNSTAAEELESTLSQTLFQNSERFIEAYNSGLVNKRNAEVSSLAQKVAKTYRNIELASSELVSISTDAISLNEIEAAFNKWSVIVAVRNAIKNFASDGASENPVNLIVSDDKKKGALYAVLRASTDSDEDALTEPPAYGDEVTSESEDSFEYVSLGRVAKDASTAENALGEYGNRVEWDDFESDVIEVDPSIQDVDTSFLERAAKELSQA